MWAREGNYLAQVVDASADAIFSKSLDLRVETWNQAAQTLFGWSAQEMVGGPVGRIVPPDLQHEPRALADRVLGGEPIVDHETVRLRRDGQRLPVALSIAPIRDSTGAVEAFAVVSRDITHRKQLEADQQKHQEKLTQAQRLESLGVLAGGIAHDFNNLLVGILGNTALALDEPDLPLPARERLLDTIAAAEHAAALTAQLLAYAGKGTINLEPLDLKDAITSLTRVLATATDGATLTLQLQPDLPHILADRSQIQQIVINLVTNAAEALPDGDGDITLTTQAVNADQAFLLPFHGTPLSPGTYVMLQVTDTGAGMSPQTAARVFEPFFTTKRLGRGLGMAAVHGIITSQRGAIAIKSTPSTGTTVQVLLQPTTTTNL